MQLLVEIFSKTQDQFQFKKDFLNFPYDLYPDLKRIPFEVESFYFSVHDLPHDFYLIKHYDKIIARFMLCHTPHVDIFYFGLIDFDLKNNFLNEAVILFKKITNDWRENNHSKSVIGPINFSTWLPYRLFSRSDGGPIFSFEPDRPLEYSHLLKNHFFKPHQIFSSKSFDGLDGFIEKTNSLVVNLQSDGYKFVPFNKELSKEDLKSLYDLSIECFRSNYLATPIDFKIFSTLYVSSAIKEDLSYCYFCYAPSGELAAFFLAFVEHDYIVAKTVGVRDSFRGKGLSNAMMNLFLKKARLVGIEKMVAAMVKEGAQSESYGRRMSLKWTHLYEILEI